MYVYVLRNLSQMVLFFFFFSLSLSRVEDIPDCQWSGGFPLDKDGAFHIHMRGNYGHSVFVRCEVALKRATYHIVLSDAANYPSPFRLENLSQISVSYCQSGAGRANVVSQLNPGQSIPYAWDEPTLPKKLCVHVKGSRESQELDFKMFGSRGKLYYESYFYIMAADTFPPKDERSVSLSLSLSLVSLSPTSTYTANFGIFLFFSLSLQP